MCGYSVTDNIYRPFVPPAEEVVRRAREVEAAMDGVRVPESAWRSFFAPSCEAIDPEHFNRMFAARKSAAAYLAVQASTRQRPRPPSAFRCVADEGSFPAWTSPT